jgi:hypothetical protein
MSRFAVIYIGGISREYGQSQVTTFSRIGAIAYQIMPPVFLLRYCATALLHAVCRPDRHIDKAASLYNE